MAKRGGRGGQYSGALYAPSGSVSRAVMDPKTLRQLHCKTLREMSETEIRQIEREYGVPVIRPQ